MLEFRQIANDEELRELQKLRYEVYCLAKRFLPATDYPDQLETDEFDAHSIHFIAIDTDKRPFKILGTLRLILDSEHRFPVENHFRLFQTIRERNRTVELSRLIITPQSRKGLTVPILMGLSREAYRYCLAKNIEHCYAVLEAPFLHILGRLGLLFEPIGPSEWYFNTENQPYYLSVSKVDKMLKKNNALFYTSLNESQKAFIV